MTIEAAKEFIEGWCFAKEIFCIVVVLLEEDHPISGASVEVTMRRMKDGERFEIVHMFGAVKLDQARDPEGLIRLHLMDMAKKLDQTTTNSR